MSILDETTEIAYIGIQTSNLQKTIKFYADLGFKTILKTFNMVLNEQVAFLQFKDIVIEANETLKIKGEVGAIDHISIHISDIETVFKEVKSRGYDLLDDEVQYLPFLGKGIKFFTVRGPSKEKIKFCQRL